MRGFKGLLWEDLKSKLGMSVVVWYVLGMFCLLFSMKRTIPVGEVRSLYVGPGNTSFFVSAVIFGSLMGAGTFRFLYSEVRTDLYLGLPLTRQQLFAAGCLNNLFIFAVPLVVSRIIFLRISLAMGYCRYEDSIPSMWMGCVVLLLAFLFMMGLAMLAFLLAQNTGYRIGLLALFLFGPGIGVQLAERMLKSMIPSFYRSDMLEALKEYLEPLSLIANATGVREYADTSFWIVQEHLPYILFMAFMVIVLMAVNLLVFNVRPAERRSGMFTFRWVEYLVRYVCAVCAVLWFVDGLQTFSVRGFSIGLAVIGVSFGVPVIHGLLNMVIAFDAGKFISARWHLLAEFLVMILVIGVFSVFGGHETKMPARENVVSAAVVMPALASGTASEQALSQMQIEGEGLSDTYEWIRKICKEKSDAKHFYDNSYDILVKFELKNGKTKYYKYQLPAYELTAFDDIYRKEEYKKGTYGVLRLDSVKYYEVRWTNGMEQYTLDLDEQERQILWEAYCTDLKKMTFTEIRNKTPIGQLTFASTKNQGDVFGYIYPGFSKTLTVLSHYGINAGKQIGDYEITEIVTDRYMIQEGLLYSTRYLAAQNTVTDPEKIAKLAKELYIEQFCVDQQLNLKDQNTEYTVYYRDSEGQTINSVKCWKGI